MASIRIDSVEIITMPSSDQDFADGVMAAVRQLAGENGHVAIEELRRELLGSYPGLLVSRKSALATFGDSPRTWYFYRDG